MQGLFGIQSHVRLHAARARWEHSGIDDYRFTLHRLCFCGSNDPVRVVVLDGSVVSQTIETTGDPVPVEEGQYYPDVPGLFAIIEEARVNADYLTTEFDETYGYPVLISIDWEERTADDEIAFRVENFERLPTL